jgi:mannose-6-phosphate isomerase-like protein (cupin superfamily)
MDEGHRFKVKRICVKPGAQLSLQKHWHRSEHWVIVTGTALVSRNGEDLMLRENESTFIPAGTVHRLTNPGHVALHMIEVQSGEYVGEDDIVRIADDYGRTDSATQQRRPVIAAEQAEKAKVKAKRAKKAIAKPHRKMRRKANPAAASRRRVGRHPMRPKPPPAPPRAPRKGKPKPPGKPRRKR